VRGPSVCAVAVSERALARQRKDRPRSLPSNSYDRHAFVMDQEAASILQTAIESLSFTMHFNL
jgi:hypothetical protein